ncbi:MAG: outer membrane protein assembly factor BamD [bacterium]
MNRRIGTFTIVIVILVFGCSGNKINYSQLTPEQQLVAAKKLFEKEKYYTAQDRFRMIVIRNPGNVIVEEAQFYLAESYFYEQKYVMAIEEYEKLIRSLPNSPYIDDAYYKVGLCYYELSPGYALDQEYTYKAISQFNNFLVKYPDSELKNKVLEKLQDCHKKLAKKVYKTAELYRKMNYLRAAVISYKDVLEEYGDTEFVPNALYWLVICNLKMNNIEEAKKYYNQLTTSYSKTVWAKRAEEQAGEIN